MTLQPIVTNRYDGQQDARGMAVPYPQPASPTLTNPDMILPDYDEPDTYHGRSQSGPSLWNSGHHIEDGFQFTQDFYANPNPLTTPIIYGNGTMLSDIGEVTEVESVVGPIPSRNASKRSNHSSGDEGPFRASLTAGKRFIQQRHQQQQQQQRQQQNDRERRMSTDSTSTIGANDGGAFIDFDDSASVGGDSIFQGDDEESMASEYVEGTAASHHLRAYDPTVRRRLSDDGTSISKRAEQILANAKMRLTRSASALGSAGGYRRPLPTSRSMDGLGSSASAQGAHGHFSYYQSDTTLEALNGNGGQRNGSRTTTSASPTPGAYSELGLTRSASASQMRDLQDQLKGLKGKISTLKEQARADSMKRRSLQSLRMPSPFTNATWEPNSADSRGFYSSGEDTPTTAEHVDGNTSNGENDHARKQPEYIAEPIEEVEEEEDQEQEQLQEQYEEQLQEQYEEQHQEQYEEQHQEQYEEQHQEQYEEQYQEQYQEQEEESGEGEGEEQGVRVIDEHPQTPEPQEDHERLEESETPKVRTLASPLEVGQQEAANGRRSSSPAESVATEYAEVESSPEAARDGYASEGEESLYHESFQQPISHEDREDAFDYEHFFLHSAMSTMTDQRLRSESVSSADSVETTRGPIVSHRRSSSADTTASVDTFATATEGLDSRSTTAQGAFRVYTAADLFEDARRRHAHSFRDSSVSSSDETASTLGTHQRSSTMTTPRPMSNSSVRSMHRPSHSSFESIGTNRSFPLINKTKLNSGILTPGGSPDQGLKNKIRDSLLTDTSSIYSQTSSNGRGGQSPALQVLSKDVQVTVEKLVASIGKCVLALGEPDGANPGGHELYKRRIEMALRVLNGEADIP
ncbi:hypothetical protein TASIC1_0001050300 [Trichoderma asperellum]|uniref:Uncharacterized protein n=1 Tax=Trichoderma asperellum TaxID=101201 RepID=A0A6V8QIQ0_TRIAP|nr:hypothetical protein TASIC1_0001050300 [Trichoderma asperellum]